jgi:Fe2+ or Zn2+ uptake regulation protein
MKQTTHSFTIEDAKKYGVECAVILYNFRFWLDKNRANQKNIHDGRVWTYNSAEAFTELFPYLSKSQVYRRLKSLEEEGAILTGNYNAHKYDQTRWYSVNESEYSISENQNDHVTKLKSGSNQSVTPIPDNKPDSKPDIYSDHPFKSKMQNDPIDVPKDLQEVLDYCKQINVPIGRGKVFHAYYDDAGWCFTRGGQFIPVANWRQKLVNDINRGWHEAEPEQSQPQFLNE